MSFTKLLIPAMRLSFISNIDSINSIVIINSIIKGEGGRGGEDSDAPRHRKLKDEK